MPKHSPPLLYAETTGATPFRLNLHVGDLGHTLMIGPPGAGKSTFSGWPRHSGSATRGAPYWSSQSWRWGVLWHRRRKNALGGLPAKGNRHALGRCVGCGLGREPVHAPAVQCDAATSQRDRGRHLPPPKLAE